MTAREPRHGGARRGAGQPPVRGMPQTERVGLRLTEAELAEIRDAVPKGVKLGPWIIEAALMRARGQLR